jgi:hypothetical protein
MRAPDDADRGAAADDEEELSPLERRCSCARTLDACAFSWRSRRRTGGRLKKVRRAKRSVRSELSVSGGEWSRHGFTNVPDLLRCACVQPPSATAGAICTIAARLSDWRPRPPCSEDGVHDTLPRVDARHVSPEVCLAPARALRFRCSRPCQEFAATYEVRRVPCIITHAMEAWPACQGRPWTWEALRERFESHKFKVGSDDAGCVAVAAHAVPRRAGRSPSLAADGT